MVLGVNGQDGSYLAEVLIERGYTVTGVARQAKSRWVDPTAFRYYQVDVAETSALTTLLGESAPAEIYHLAAVHGAAEYVYETGWREALAVNVGSVHTCLEYMRNFSPSTRLFYASSLKVFGLRPPSRIDETSPRISGCLYSIMKNAATELIHYYRRLHGVWATVGYYFNHDSPRRPDNYFLPRLAASIASQLTRGNPMPSVATLDFWCDWGSSREFMEATADLLLNDRPSDVIFATGHPVYAGALADELYNAAGLTTLGRPVPPPEDAPFRADVTKLREAVGWLPRQRAADVARWILRERHSITLRTDAATRR